MPGHLTGMGDGTAGMVDMDNDIDMGNATVLGGDPVDLASAGAWITVLAASSSPADRRV